MSRSVLLLTAFATFGTTSGPVIAQVLDQRPLQTRTFQNPEMEREAVGHVHGIMTEDIFGFTLGSDTEEARGPNSGDRERRQLREPRSDLYRH
jgi:hypothetical protein